MNQEGNLHNPRFKVDTSVLYDVAAAKNSGFEQSLINIFNSFSTLVR